MTVQHDFSGKRAVVTGAAKGIDRRTAEKLRDAGAQVSVWDLAPRQIDGIRSCTVDIRDRDQVATALNDVLGEREEASIFS